MAICQIVGRQRFEDIEDSCTLGFESGVVGEAFEVFDAS